MKLMLSFLLCLLGSFALSAQTAWYHFAEEFYFVKEIPAKNLRGKNFRYEIAVKANPADTLSKVRIHGIAVGQGSNDFINSDFKVESRTEQDWVIYTIIGTVNQNAWRLWFYSAVNGNGTFYFDDIDFYVELQPGQWKQLKLFNSSFEENTTDIFAGYYVSKRKTTTLSTQLSKKIYKSGKQSLLVNSMGQNPVQATNTVKNKTSHN